MDYVVCATVCPYHAKKQRERGGMIGRSTFWFSLWFSVFSEFFNISFLLKMKIIFHLQILRRSSHKWGVDFQHLVFPGCSPLGTWQKRLVFSQDPSGADWEVGMDVCFHKVSISQIETWMKHQTQYPTPCVWCFCAGALLCTHSIYEDNVGKQYIIFNLIQILSVRYWEILWLGFKNLFCGANGW